MSPTEKILPHGIARHNHRSNVGVTKHDVLGLDANHLILLVPHNRQLLPKLLLHTRHVDARDAQLHRRKHLHPIDGGQSAPESTLTSQSNLRIHICQTGDGRRVDGHLLLGAHIHQPAAKRPPDAAQELVDQRHLGCALASRGKRVHRTYTPLSNTVKPKKLNGLK
jgi:hypothetical protein